MKAMPKLFMMAQAVTTFNEAERLEIKNDIEQEDNFSGGRIRSRLVDKLMDKKHVPKIKLTQVITEEEVQEINQAYDEI